MSESSAPPLSNFRYEIIVCVFILLVLVGLSWYPDIPLRGNQRYLPLSCSVFGCVFLVLVSAFNEYGLAFGNVYVAEHGYVDPHGALCVLLAFRNSNAECRYCLAFCGVLGFRILSAMACYNPSVHIWHC